MIYVTGDTLIPSDVYKLNTTNFVEQKAMTENDYLIICGDFGAVWNLDNSDLYWIKWFNDKNFTTLFIDGNHENFDLLNNNFEVLDFCGGKAHKIADKVYHLMRGEVFVLDGLKIFAMGGAESHDKQYRKEGESWWEAELPSNEEYANAENNLALHDYKVDYVISHCASTSTQMKIKPKYTSNDLTTYFEMLKPRLSYTKWYFGHYHVDKQFGGNERAIFEDIVLI